MHDSYPGLGLQKVFHARFLPKKWMNGEMRTIRVGNVGDETHTTFRRGERSKETLEAESPRRL